MSETVCAGDGVEVGCKAAYRANVTIMKHTIHEIYQLDVWECKSWYGSVSGFIWFILFFIAAQVQRASAWALTWRLLVIIIAGDWPEPQFGETYLQVSCSEPF